MTEPNFIWHSTSDQLAEFKNGIELALDAQVSSILILACSENGFTADDIDPIISTLDIPVFGGIYPMLINGDKSMQQGVIIVGYPVTLAVSNITQLCQKTKYIDGLELTLENDKELSSHSSFLIFYDGLSSASEDFIDCFYDCTGYGVTVAGGGAGSLDFIQRPCIFSNAGLLEDAIQLVGLPVDLQLGVAHGWEILDGPYLVTEAQGPLVNSLNYQSAMELYQSRVEALSDYRFNEHNFFDIAKHFPLGIEGPNGEILVRDPIKTINNSLQCVGNVPVNSMINILKGDSASLVASAKNAAVKAASSAAKINLSSMIIFDCISRVLYMGDNFERELSAINSANTSGDKVFGVLSLGEVANTQSGSIGLLNKSTVIGRF